MSQTGFPLAQPEPSAVALDPGMMLSHVLENTADIGTQVRGLIEPIARQRVEIRNEFERLGMIRSLLSEPSPYTVGAVDGAYTSTPLALGDHLAVLAVAVQGTGSDDPSIRAFDAWSTFRAHTAATETLAKAVMMASEIRLAAGAVGEDVTILDGSHVTPLIAINMALASEDPTVRDEVLALSDAGLVDAVARVATAQHVVACPKADSSRELWNQVARSLHLVGRGIPDKLVAALILEPGEVLVSDRATPSWERLHVSFNQVHDPRAKDLAEQFRDAIADLRQRSVRVFHIKPERASTVLRVEVKPDVDDFTAADYLRALADNCAAPHVQEPVVQHVADVVAKQVSSIAAVQLHKTRLDLADAGADQAYQEFLIRGYRTL